MTITMTIKDQIETILVSNAESERLLLEKYEAGTITRGMAKKGVYEIFDNNVLRIQALIDQEKRSILHEVKQWAISFQPDEYERYKAVSDLIKRIEVLERGLFTTL